MTDFDIDYDIDDILLDKIFEEMSPTRYAEKNTLKPESKLCCITPYFTEHEGYEVCCNCGVSLKGRIFDESIFSFDTGTDNMFLRSKINPLYPQSSIGTKIQGNSRLAQIQNWNSMPYREHVVWEVSNDLRSLLFGYFSHKVVTDAVVLFKDIYNKMGIHRGDNKKGIIAACVYHAAKNNNADKSPKQIAAIMDIDISLFNKSAKFYSEISGDRENKNTKASDFTESYCNTLKLSFKIRKTVTKICNIIDERGILNCFPHNACLGVIFFTCKEMGIEMDLKDTCNLFDVSPGTINKIYKNILLEKQNIFSKCVRA